jgi:small-conductance mechanosensitive channel
MIDNINDKLGLTPDIQVKILISLLIIFVFWLLRFLILKLVWRWTEEPRTRYLWKRYVSFVFSTIAILLIGGVWIQALRQFGAFLGLMAAGLAIALKDPLTNIAGWLFITTRKPFTVGDRIQIGEHAGDVIDIRLFQFTLLEIGNWVNADQSTGRVIHIPNGKVFMEAQANYSRGFQYIWNEVPVLITFESNWTKAKSLMEKIVNKHAEHLSKAAEKRVKEATKKYLITYMHLTPIVYTSVMDSGVLLTMRYLCDPRKRRTSEHDIWEDILTEFARNGDIDFAYPTQRFYTLSKDKDASPPG